MFVLDPWKVLGTPGCVNMPSNYFPKESVPRSLISMFVLDNISKSSWYPGRALTLSSDVVRTPRASRPGGIYKHAVQLFYKESFPRKEGS